MNKVATFLLFINFVTVLFPQPGYIHPDEFFQTTEVVAGDILDVQHTRTWEFNSSFPVRNLAFTYMTVGPSLYFLKWLNSLNIKALKMTTVKLVMATRLPIAFFNLFGFVVAGRLAERFNSDRYICQVLWCSSYVTWTYFTRTFSNSIESLLFAIVLLLIVQTTDLLHSGEGTSQSGNVKKYSDIKDKKNTDNEEEDNKENENPSKRKKDREKPMKVVHNKDEKPQKDTVKEFTPQPCQGLSALVLAFLCTAGFFNRPTFLLFVLIPVLYWFISICSPIFKNFNRIMWVLVCAGFGSVVSFIVFTLFDSIYYNPEFINVLLSSFNNIIENNFSLQSVIDNFDLIISSLTFTPWNFLRYNKESSNLALHGVHPYYTHFVVNLPLLIGPLYYPFMGACLFSFVQLSRPQGKSFFNPSNSIWLVLMALFPIVALSIFPHQEPRFLIPLLPVICVLGSKLVTLMSASRKLFFVLWVVFNLLLHLIYGYFHQAAIIPALSIYQKKLATPKVASKLKLAGTNHAFFFHTYPPPLHLLLLHPNDDYFQVHDLAGTSVGKLVGQVKSIEKEKWARNKKNQVFIFVPATVSNRITDLLTSDLEEYGAKISITSICPHLSTENMPRFKNFWNGKIPFHDFIGDFCLNVIAIT